MRWGVTYYKRRRPWLGTPPAPSASGLGRLVTSPLLVAGSGLAARSRPGRVVFSRPPWQAPAPVHVRPTTPLVVSQGTTRPGRVVFSRPPLKAPPPPVAGGTFPARVLRGPVPYQLLEGRVVLGRLLSPALPGLPVVRLIQLRARADNQVGLRAAGKTAYFLRASERMSISAKLTFFQGEDITLTFSLTPPQDMTGWTLTGTVKNQLGGTTQFTFTPTILDTGRGVFQATWGRSSTTGLVPGDYVWDVRRTDSGNNTVLAHGEITVKQAVTA